MEIKYLSYYTLYQKCKEMTIFLAGFHPVILSKISASQPYPDSSIHLCKATEFMSAVIKNLMGNLPSDVFIFLRH